MKINKEQYNTLLKNMYIADGGVVDFSVSANLYEDIMLITASCGRGKTTYALSLSASGLLAQINQKRKKDDLFNKSLKDIQPDEMLFLTSRKSIKKQQLSNKDTVQAISADFNNSLFDFEKSNRKGKIRIATAHQFGGWVKSGEIEIIPKIIILDELHSIFSESVFADDLLYTIEFIKENYNKLIKIGLTATPQFLLNYIKDDKLSFKVIDKDLGSKYKCRKVKTYIKGQAITILKQIKPKISSSYKMIYYTQSAKQCYKLAKEYGEKAAFLISDYNDTVINGEKLIDIMEKQGVKEYILKNEKLPKDIDIIFINSACREGMNIKDDNIKVIICEAIDMITIEQILGRIRNNLEEFIVICNNNNAEKNRKNIKDFINFINDYEAAENPLNELARRYGRQEENKQLQKYVYLYKGEYKLNNYARAYLQYIDESYIQLSNYATKNKMQYIRQIGNRKLLLCEDYLYQLSRYAETEIIDIETIWKATINQNHNNALEIFQKIESKWINKNLSIEDKKTLCAELHIIRSNGKAANWNTVKEILINNGYSINDKRIGKDRKSISIITK